MAWQGSAKTRQRRELTQASWEHSHLRFGVVGVDSSQASRYLGEKPFAP